MTVRKLGPCPFLYSFPAPIPGGAQPGSRVPKDAFRIVKKKPGNDLLSHSAARAVPSARAGLTSVFGMGTGVSPPLKSPGFFFVSDFFEVRVFLS
jgi:hypothetical protein